MADRSYVSGRFALMLGGSEMAGFLKSVDGGGLKADLIAEPAGPDNIIHKHIGSPKVDDFKCQVGWSMSPGFYEWIQQSWDKKYARKAGEVISCDFDYKAKSSREFTEALITEVGIPALDGSSKEPAYMTVGFRPETLKYKKGDGNVVKGTFTQHQKAWLPANFRFTLGDMNTKKISKVDAFTVKQTVTSNDVGEERWSQIEPAKLEFPDLTIYTAESHAQTWIDWATEFIINGNNGDKNEKSGSITFLSPSLKDELGSVELMGVGIKSVAPEKSEANGEAIKKVKIELYVEQMKMKYGGNVQKV